MKTIEFKDDELEIINNVLNKALIDYKGMCAIGCLGKEKVKILENIKRKIGGK